jgi:hypothetical protein
MSKNDDDIYFTRFSFVDHAKKFNLDFILKYTNTIIIESKNRDDYVKAEQRQRQKRRLLRFLLFSFERELMTIMVPDCSV